MSKNLVIVESPAKSKTIKKYLGSDYTVEASMGHIIDLPEKEFGVDIEKNFKPKYQTIQGKTKIITKLKEAAKKADNIYLASDPDREGEAIAWHISKAIKVDDKKIHRVLFNEITKKGITEAMKKPGKLNMNLVNAQQARRILDRIVGYQVSPILWKSITRGLSAGRVQSVALRLICEREEEIEKFVPEEYWSITAKLQGEKGNPFFAKLFKIDGKKVEIKNEDSAKSILSDLNGAKYIVVNIEKKERVMKAPPPFITSTLQQDASRRLGFSPSKTMQIAQQLYEGVEIGDEGSVGLITYMRTDSTRIANEAIDEARQYIKDELGDKYLPTSANIYSTKDSAQDAHEAIRPTSAFRTPKDLEKYLDKDLYRLYELIWQRFIASQMNPAIYDTTTIDIDAKASDNHYNDGKYIFRATGSVIKFDGFLSVYPLATTTQKTKRTEDEKTGKQENETDEDENGEEEEGLLPELSMDELLKLLELIPKQHFTKPPPRYSEATLIKELEALGIGRPSTYATIVGTIMDREYVKKIERKLHPTELGKVVNKLLVKAFSNIFNTEFTSQMEADLDKIESGEIDWVTVLNEFYKPFKEQLDKVEENRKELKKWLQTKTEEKCPDCGKNLIVKWTKRGPFLSCSGYPECKFAKPISNGEEEKPQPVITEHKCELCGGDMVVRKSRRGEFLGCSNYPKCKNIKTLAGEKIENKVETPQETDEKCEKCGSPMIWKKTWKGSFLACSAYPKCKNIRAPKIGVKCPKCGGDIVQKKSKKSVFYGCSNYPNCDFAVWDKPVNQKCPNCDSPYLLEKVSKSGSKLKCPNCEYES